MCHDETLEKDDKTKRQYWQKRRIREKERKIDTL